MDELDEFELIDIDELDEDDDEQDEELGDLLSWVCLVKLDDRESCKELVWC